MPTITRASRPYDGWEPWQGPLSREGSDAFYIRGTMVSRINDNARMRRTHWFRVIWHSCTVVLSDTLLPRLQASLSGLHERSETGAARRRSNGFSNPIASRVATLLKDIDLLP